MKVVIELVRDICGSDCVTLFLHDSQTNELYSHITLPETIDIAIPSDLGIAGACFTTNQIINTPDAYTDVRFYSGIDRKIGTPTTGILAIPIVSSDDQKKIKLGVLELVNKKRVTPFNESEQKDALFVVKMIVTIVEKAWHELKLIKKKIQKKG